MKKTLILLSFFAFFKAYSQNLPNHPRILLLKNEENTISENIRNDKNWAKIHQTIIDESDKIIILPTLERIQIGRRLLDKSRECLRRVFYLSYAYRISKDKKYFDRCEAELLKVAQFSDWNPSHFLDVAEMTLGVAIGYDWLYNDLSENSRNIIKEAILKKGIEPSIDPKYNSWLKESHNWNQVCNAGMTYGALAIYEDNPTLSKQIIERAKESIKLPLEDYNPDGAYPEGYGYWGYGTSFHVLFLSALKTIQLNDNQIDTGLIKTASYFQNMLGTSGKSFNYSDAGNGAGLNAAMFWFAYQSKNNSLLFNEKNYLNDASKMSGNRILPAAMIWGKELKLDNIDVPTQKTWIGQGKNPVAMMRTSWTDPNAIYVGFKTGSASVNHAHMDIGSFVMDAGGERWALDLGMQEYESLESKGIKLWDKTQNGQRWEIMRYNNFYHNTLTFNQQLQNVEGKASINNFTKSPNFLSATSNLSDIYKGHVEKIERGVAIIDEKYVVIKDEIEVNLIENIASWNMLTAAKVEYIKGNTAKLSQNGKVLFIKIVEPQNSILVSSAVKSDKDYDAPNDGITKIGFEHRLPKNSSSSLTILLMPDKKIRPKKIKPLSQWK
jgi:hypothetical protein